MNSWDILIASLWSRTDSLIKLLETLEPQLSEDAQVIVARDNATEPIGTKRQRLLEASDASYCNFVDDDDMVSDNYVGAITIALLSQPDVVNFRVAYSIDGVPQDSVVHSLDKKRGGYKKDGVPGRLIGAFTHLSPMKRDIARSAKFEGDYGEDGRWSTAIDETGLVKSEAFINEILYHYRWSTDNHFGQTSPIDTAEPQVPEFPFVRYV